MRVLAVNPGSSSIKATLLEGPRVFFDHEWPMGDSVADLRSALGPLTMGQATDPPEAIGVRVVHGGRHFSRSVLVDESVISALSDLVPLAPLHLPLAIRVLRALSNMEQGLPVVAVFDTQFHRTIPDETRRYALPSEWQEKEGVEKYGFHGLSYDYLVDRLPAVSKGPLPERLVAVHWGNGASVCAIRQGVSVDTSMGMTPLDGLVMGSRPGSIDPGIIPMLLRKGYALETLDSDLNHRSGLFAVSEGVKDFREIEERMRAGDPRAKMAFDKAVMSVAMTIGSYAVILGGLDSLVFSGGIGEHSKDARSAVMKRLEFLSVFEDLRNNAEGSFDRKISAEQSKVPVWVIHAREDRTIARETERVLSRSATDPP